MLDKKITKGKIESDYEDFKRKLKEDITGVGQDSNNDETKEDKVGRVTNTWESVLGLGHLKVLKYTK